MQQTILFNPHGGHSKVVGDDGMGTITSRVKRAHELGIVTAVTPHNTTESWDEYLTAMEEVGWGHLAVLGVEFKYYTSVNGNKYKGEMIVLLPPEPQLMKIIRELVVKWNQVLARKDTVKNLKLLLSFSKEIVHPDLYSELVWYWPHPYSIDNRSFLGKLMVYALNGRLTLKTPEMRHPEVFTEVHAIEVLNAAHPGRINRKAMILSEKKDFFKMAKMAGADDHHDAWVGVAYTLVEVKEVTSQGILDAIRNQRTIPMSTLGKLSETNWPFLLWSMLVPMKGINVTAGWVAGFVKRKVEKSLNEL